MRAHDTISMSLPLSRILLHAALHPRLPAVCVNSPIHPTHSNLSLPPALPPFLPPSHPPSFPISIPTAPPNPLLPIAHVREHTTLTQKRLTAWSPRSMPPHWPHIPRRWPCILFSVTTRAPVQSVSPVALHHQEASPSTPPLGHPDIQLHTLIPSDLYCPLPGTETPSVSRGSS